MKRRLVLVVIFTATVLGVGWWRLYDPASKPLSGTNSLGNTTTTPQAKQFDKTKYSTSDPASIWVVVNKKRPLNPINYIPARLVIPAVPLRVPGNETMQLAPATSDALQTIFAAAKAEGLQLMLSSGYRSYTYQQGLYHGYVQTQGQSAADNFSAQPGHSEHQTGLAADIEPVSRKCELEQCFADTPEGKWLAANAYKYGFIIRYTTAKQSVTGYANEPWHIRYVGTQLSTEMHNQNILTLEEFFGLGSGV